MRPDKVTLVCIAVALSFLALSVVFYQCNKKPIAENEGAAIIHTDKDQVAYRNEISTSNSGYLTFSDSKELSSGILAELREDGSLKINASEVKNICLEYMGDTRCKDASLMYFLMGEEPLPCKEVPR